MRPWCAEAFQLLNLVEPTVSVETGRQCIARCFFFARAWARGSERNRAASWFAGGSSPGRAG